MARKTLGLRNKRKKYKVTNNQKKKHKKNYRKSKNDYKKSKKGKGKGFFERLFSRRNNKTQIKMFKLQKKFTPPGEVVERSAAKHLISPIKCAHLSQKQEIALGDQKLNELIFNR